jgi:excisionase family DNA binding protein
MGATVKTMIQNKLLTRGEVAELLSVSIRTIARFYLSGDLPYIKVGNQVRFRLSDVEAFLKNNTHSH